MYMWQELPFFEAVCSFQHKTLFLFSGSRNYSDRFHATSLTSYMTVRQSSHKAKVRRKAPLSNFVHFVPLFDNLCPWESVSPTVLPGFRGFIFHRQSIVFLRCDKTLCNGIDTSRIEHSEYDCEPVSQPSIHFKCHLEPYRDKQIANLIYSSSPLRGYKSSRWRCSFLGGVRS